MEKLNKRDCTLINLYKVISLFNCLGKVIEKLVIEKLFQFCKAQEKFHKGQIGGKKH